MNSREVHTQISAAADLVQAAGDIALRWFRKPIDIANKAEPGSFDPVTRADQEVEAYLRAELEVLYPDHRILGEESGEGGGLGPLRWVIDPIDGTRAFVSGNPLWGVMLGLDDGDRALGGVVHIPYLGETYAGTGTATWLRRGGRDEPARCRDMTALADAIVYCTHPDTLGGGAHEEAFDELTSRTRMLRFGGDCYSYCLLALGQVDLVVEGCLQPYDVVPVLPIVTGAGGVMTDWKGGPAERGGRVVAAATAELHARALEILGGAV